MKKLLTEVKACAPGGSLDDLAIGVAIGVAIGLAFAAVVDSLVKDIILPLVAAIFGQPSFQPLHDPIRGTRIPYGDFLTDSVDFLLLVKEIRKLAGVEAAGAQGGRECPSCRSFIGVDVSVCRHRTRDVEPLVAG